MTHEGIKAHHYTHEGDNHILLLTLSRVDNCFHYFHLKNGTTVERKNFGRSKPMAMIDFEQEISILEAMMNCG